MLINWGLYCIYEFRHLLQIGTYTKSFGGSSMIPSGTPVKSRFFQVVEPVPWVFDDAHIEIIGVALYYIQMIYVILSAARRLPGTITYPLMGYRSTL